jgi:DUF4097 and DUF4098 domain-containing protein YvlB
MKRHMGFLFLVALFIVACGTVSSQQYSETLEATFPVGDAPVLTVDNFGGAVAVVAGDGGTIDVTATKRASQERDLDDIEVKMNGRETTVDIKTDRPSGFSNTSVQIEIKAPPSARLTVRTGGGDISVAGLEQEIRLVTGGGSIEVADAAGPIDAETGGGGIVIRDATGTVDARTGGGNIEARGAAGPVQLETGGGKIDYEGRPAFNSRFETGGGSITLRLPSDINIKLDLETGGGEIDLGFPVEGDVSKQEVRGTIGSGEEGVIYAATGGGSIDVIEQ